ncbi:MAG: CDP-paratose 2-epimerase [Elusimicrobia bacterium RIFCSPHIGHO2_02_FULL_57_9]|nr:MAG: CDP-paratose 2-epimerase [Elusimicrobia bacterium RIFCSPHIGHO2_02_FULL_57_9]
MKYLITGGCGFLGTNLSAEVLQRGDELLVLDDLSRMGSDRNLEWLKKQGRFQFFQADIRSAGSMDEVIKKNRPNAVFHLAGQVAMTASLADPRLDFENNALGSLNLLEAVRRFSPGSTIAYSSTNKVYGDLEELEYAETPSRYVATGYERGFDEKTRIDFRSPYGCSKGSADQYMLDYARCFGLKTIVFRHSSIFGSRQFSTSEQGWIGWFVQQALEAKGSPGKDPFTISGNGKQVRDVLFSSDLVDCYFSAVESISRVRGQAFNIGGGADNSISLIELFTFLGRELGVELRYKSLPQRQSDQKVFVANVQKARKLFGWSPKVDKEQGLRKMIDWICQNAG